MLNYRTTLNDNWLSLIKQFLLLIIVSAACLTIAQSPLWFGNRTRTVEGFGSGILLIFTYPPAIIIYGIFLVYWTKKLKALLQLEQASRLFRIIVRFTIVLPYLTIVLSVSGEWMWHKFMYSIASNRVIELTHTQFDLPFGDYEIGKSFLLGDTLMCYLYKPYASNDSNIKIYCIKIHKNEPDSIPIPVGFELYPENTQKALRFYSKKQHESMLARSKEAINFDYNTKLFETDRTGSFKYSGLPCKYYGTNDLNSWLCPIYPKYYWDFNKMAGWRDFFFAIVYSDYAQEYVIRASKKETAIGCYKIDDTICILKENNKLLLVKFK